MEGPSKSSRTNDEEGGTGSMAGVGDRLSALPDCLLHEIMSRMQARQVVQTCVLSTRWRHLWRSVPCIDADQAEFAVAAAGAATVSDMLEAWWEKFEEFMDMLLSPGNVSIAHLDKFRLRVTGHSSERRRGYRWIRRGIKYGGGGGFSSTRSWHLRKLHLDNVCLDALFSEHVGSGCPNLEDLELTGCTLEFHAITSGSLKNLVMERCTMMGVSEITSPAMNSLVIHGGSNTEDCLLVVTAPAAASVLLVLGAQAACGFLGGFSVRELTLLAKVSVSLLAWKVDDYLKMLGSVSDVTTNLKLCDAKVLGEWSATFPQFNLRALELNRCDLSDGFQTLELFLRNSPNLERLILRRCKYSNEWRKKKGSSKSKNLLDVPCKNLKLTEIIYRGKDIRQLTELLLCISENLPNNCIKLIKN